MNSKKPIRSKSDILEFFEAASLPRKELLIGLEVERSAVFDRDLSPVQYAGPHGYLAILKKLVDTILSKGGSKDPNILLKDFLGRKPNNKAFLTDIGA